jgi:DNA polymerase-1
LYYGKSEKQILAALRRLAKMKRGTLGIDIETAGPDPMTDRITVIGMATNAVSVSLLWPPEQHFKTIEDAEEAYQLTAKILAGPLRKAAHNGIHDILGLKQIGLTVGNYTLDTILMHHVAGNTLKHDLGFVSQTEFACDPWKKIFKVTGDAKGLERFLRAKPGELTLYNAKDTAILPPLASALANRLDNTNNGWELYNGYLERSHIALSMQQWGARISQGAVERHEKPLKRRIRDARREIRQAALETGRKYLHIGDNIVPIEDFNPASNPQRKELFFKVLRVRPRIYTPKGEPSLKEEFVQLLTAHHNPIVAKCARALLRYRKYTKLYGTYIKGLRGVGRVYPQAKVWGTKAGRWSYDNFPAQTTPKILRDIVIASVGNWIASADYRQLEMRIMAWLSGDPLLLDWFETGKDPHSETAIGLFGSAEGEFRDIAKTSNYADAYGADSKTLWINITKSLPKLGITLLDVERIQESKARLHPTLVQWRRDLLAKAQADDYVEHPLSGRRIHFHGEVEPSKVYNSPIQGTAADIINRAIVGVHRDILKIPNSHLLFQVHDELVVDASDPVRAAKVLCKHMSAKVTLKMNGKISTMKFPVDYKIGHDWGKGMRKFESIEDIEKWWSKLGTRKRKGAK